MVNAVDPCQEAERLVELYRADERRLRDARRQLNRLSDELQSALPLSDRGQLVAAKAQAQRAYRQAYLRATDQAAVQQAAADWLSEITRLNREASRASRGGERAADRLTELEAEVRRLEFELDASRIRAEAARDRCNEARRVAAAAADDGPALALAGAPGSRGGREPAITLLLRGNRLILHQVANRLAEDTDLDAGRLQLLIIELCEQIAGSALDASAISFPPEHELWRQLDVGEARQLARTMSDLGYRFDGRGGWLDDRVPPPRQVAYALAHIGLDSRFRRQPSQDMIATLWRGAQLEAVEHLVQRAPDLSIDEVQRMLGPRAAALDELWDNWSHVRRALLS